MNTESAPIFLLYHKVLNFSIVNTDMLIIYQSSLVDVSEGEQLPVNYCLKKGEFT